jgi:hypothetical protein
VVVWSGKLVLRLKGFAVTAITSIPLFLNKKEEFFPLSWKLFFRPKFNFGLSHFQETQMVQSK